VIALCQVKRTELLAPGGNDFGWKSSSAEDRALIFGSFSSL